DRARLDADEMKAEKERRRQVRVGQVDCAFELHQLFELFRRAEPLDAAFQIAADRMPEVHLRDVLANFVAPLGKAQLQVDMDNAAAPARNLVEQPAKAVAKACNEPVRQERE